MNDKTNYQFPYKNLEVWHDAMELSLFLYKVTSKFPRAEQYGITDQLKRAGVSVPLNIAEGKGRQYKKEFIQFLFQARGSLYEVMTISEIILALEYINHDEFQKIEDKTQRVMAKLSGLIKSLKDNK